MRSAIFAITMVLSLALCAEEVRAADDTFPVFGIGGQSCAYWLSNSYREAEGKTWILGFWTGLNYSKSLKTGQSVDNEGIFGEIEKTCRENPSEDLAVAALVVWAVLGAKGR